MSLKHRKTCVGLAVQGVAQHMESEIAEEVLTNVVISCLDRYQQKVKAGVEDSTSDLLDVFKQKVAEEIFEVGQGWKVEEREPELFPKNCRFFYRKGKHSIAIVEQEPCVRTLNLMAGLSGNSSTHGDAIVNRHALAMPYVLFFVHSKKGIFQNLYMAFRTRPLNSLQDALGIPTLPNIHDNLNVCLGHDFTATTIESPIGHFWSAAFNHDLSDRWQDKRTVSPLIKTAWEWEINTEENPLFILGLSFRTFSKNVQEMVDFIGGTDETPRESKLRHRLTESIDDCSRRLFNRLMRYFKKTKFERYYPSDVTQNVKDAMISSENEVREMLDVLNHEVKNLKTDIKKKEEKEKGRDWKSAGPLWNPHGGK